LTAASLEGECITEAGSTYSDESQLAKRPLHVGKAFKSFPILPILLPLETYIAKLTMALEQPTISGSGSSGSGSTINTLGEVSDVPSLFYQLMEVLVTFERESCRCCGENPVTTPQQKQQKVVI
jgi:hypothetical protein